MSGTISSRDAMGEHTDEVGLSRRVGVKRSWSFSGPAGYIHRSHTNLHPLGLQIYPAHRVISIFGGAELTTPQTTGLSPPQARVTRLFEPGSDGSPDGRRGIAVLLRQKGCCLSECENGAVLDLLENSAVTPNVISYTQWDR